MGGRKTSVVGVQQACRSLTHPMADRLAGKAQIDVFVVALAASRGQVGRHVGETKNVLEDDIEVTPEQVFEVNHVPSP